MTSWTCDDKFWHNMKWNERNNLFLLYGIRNFLARFYFIRSYFMNLWWKILTLYMKYLSSLQNMCMLKKYFLLHQKNLCQIEFWICKILHSHPSGTSKRIFLVNKLAINTSPQLIPEIYEDLQCFSPTLKMKTKLGYLFPTLSILKVTHL